MIQRKDILSIAYMKKAAFTGSYQGMRYRLKRVTEPEEMLQVVIWEGPYNFEVTSEEQKVYKEFSFSEEGVCQAVEWLNQTWQQQEERWQQVRNI